MTADVMNALLKSFDWLGLPDRGRLFNRALGGDGDPFPRREVPTRRGYRIPPSPAPSNSPPVTLDFAKVASLKEEQAHLDAVLAAVFAEALPEAGTSAVTPLPARTPLSLDPAASAFLQTLLTQSTWTRAALAQLARTHSLPLDGVLERINEAAYEHLEVPLFEEGEPLVLNREAVEKIESQRSNE
jgi:hypothetical protein